MTTIQLINTISNLTKNGIKYRNPNPEQIKSFLTDLIKTSSDKFVKESQQNTAPYLVKVVIKNKDEKNISELLKEYRLKKLRLK